MLSRLFHATMSANYLISCSSKLLLVQIRNVAFQKICLDSPTRKSDHHKPVGLYPCHRQGGNQVFCRSYFDRLRQYHFAGVVIQNCLMFFFGSAQFSIIALFHARWTARFFFYST